MKQNNCPKFHVPLVEKINALDIEDVFKKKIMEDVEFVYGRLFMLEALINCKEIDSLDNESIRDEFKRIINFTKDVIKREG